VLLFEPTHSILDAPEAAIQSNRDFIALSLAPAEWLTFLNQ
jgi:hypothetical protein